MTLFTHESTHPVEYYCDECSPPSHRDKDIAAGLKKWDSDQFPPEGFGLKLQEAFGEAVRRATLGEGINRECGRCGRHRPSGSFVEIPVGGPICDLCDQETGPPYGDMFRPTRVIPSPPKTRNLQDATDAGLLHRVTHLLKWHKGRVVSWLVDSRVWVGFQCEICGVIDGAHDTDDLLTRLHG